MMRRWFSVMVVIAVLAGSHDSGRADQPKVGGTLTMAVRRDMGLMNPLVGTKSIDKAIRGLLFEPLLGLDLNGKIHPNLAESWSVSEDGKHYTFKLRKGVKFHDGKAMTAEDVKFSMDYTMNPKNGAYGLSDLMTVGRVVVVGPYTLKIDLKTASPAFLSLLTSIRAFSVVPKGSLEEGVLKPAHFPPGTGPFRFVEWKSKQRIVLERYEHYWGHKALVDRLVLRPIRNSTVRFTALRAGDVDMVDTTPLEWVQQVVEGKIKGIGFASAPREILSRLQFNVQGDPFKNKKLRLAVGHAINKQEVMQAAFYDFGQPTEQKYPKGHVWYLEGIRWPAYDLDKARMLLREAGYKGGTIKLMIEPANEVTGTTVQAQLKKIGMNIELDVMERGAFTSRVRRGDFAMRITGGSFYPDPSHTYGNDLRCPSDPARRSSNTSGYCDKGVDQLIEQAETEPDPGKRRALFKQILRKISQDLPEVYLGFGPRFFTFRDYVKGFTTDDNADYRWWRGGLHYTWLDR